MTGITDLATRGLRRARLLVRGPGTAERAPVAAADPLARCTAWLPQGRDRIVVVLGTKALRRQVRPWFTQFRDDRLHVISAGTAPEWQLKIAAVSHHVGETVHQIHWLLKLLGPVDVIIDLTAGDPDAIIDRCQRFLYHLKPDGVYVIDQAAFGGNAFTQPMSAWLSRLLKAEDTSRAVRVSTRAAEAARAVDGVFLTRDLVLITKRDHHLLKLRDSETERLVLAREPMIAVKILGAKPKGELQSRATVISHQSSVETIWLDQVLKHPPLHLRHYHGEIGYAGNTLMFGENSVLADSFRHHLGGNPDNPRMVNVAPSFARIPDNAQPRRRLEGDYYQIDCSFSGHFGHLMTETVSRLWGWDEAKRVLPDLKALVRANVPVPMYPKFERHLFNAYGIADGDIVWMEEPVLLESIVAATPMWHNQHPHYVHPEITQTFQRLGDALIDWDSPRHDKIFVSRAGTWKRRTCRNVRDVESYFEARGFSVIYPETLPLTQQAGMFAQAKVVAGFGGSALFNIMFARNLSTLIVLSHEAYTARNEHLFTALVDCTVHYFWSPPDIAHPQGGWSQEAFYSDWDFDFARNGEELSSVLAEI